MTLRRISLTVPSDGSVSSPAGILTRTQRSLNMMLPDSLAERDWYAERLRRYYGEPGDVDMLYEARGDPDRHTPPEPAAPPLTAPPVPAVSAAPIPARHPKGCVCDDICSSAARWRDRRRDHRGGLTGEYD